MSPERVAFIGLGAMGEPMARRLVAAGHRVVVHNRSKAACSRLVSLGASTSATAREAVHDVSIVITMLPDGPDVARVAREPDGILGAGSAGTTWLEMSTIAPATARALGAEAGSAGIRFLDAPVSGGTAGARDGTLTIMVGGDPVALERVRPVLDELGSHITLVGEVGAGQVAKAANQLIVGGTIGLVAEALVLAERLGADPERVADALVGGFASSRVLEIHGPRMRERAFAPGFRCALQRKDLAIVRAAAESVGLELGLADAALALFNRQCDGDGDGAELDHSAAIEAVRASPSRG